MNSKKAIKILTSCIVQLEVLEERVREVENDEFCLYTTPRTCLRGSSAHIYVALSRIRNAVKWQKEAELEQHNK